MKSYAVVLLSAGVLGTVIGFAQSTKETSESHVAAAKAAARQEHTALSPIRLALRATRRNAANMALEGRFFVLWRFVPVVGINKRAHGI